MRIDKPAEPLVLLHTGQRSGRPALTVTIGYLSRFDGAVLTERQAWPLLDARFAGQPFDEGMKKARGTYAVAGDACAPAGTTVDALRVSVRFAHLEKHLAVFGDRVWKRGLTGWLPGLPAPFERMPVDLAHAFGGPGCSANPQGRGFAPDGAQWAHVALPNVEHPDALCVSPSARPSPAGLGRLPAQAPERVQWLGEHALRRGRVDWALADPRFFDAVDPDQCAPDYFVGDETFAVKGMSAQAASLAGALPGLRPRLLWRGAGTLGAAPVTECALDLDTVWLLPNEAVTLSLYRACWPVTDIDADDVAALHVVTERLNGVRASTAELARAWDAASMRPARQPASRDPSVDAGRVKPAATPAQATLAAAGPVSAADGAWAARMASHGRLVKLLATQPDAQALLDTLPEPDRTIFDAARAGSSGEPRRRMPDMQHEHLEALLARLGAPSGVLEACVDAPVAGGRPDPADVAARFDGLPAAQRAVLLKHWQTASAARQAAGQKRATAEPSGAMAGRRLATLDRASLIARLARGESVRDVRLAGESLAGLNFEGVDFSASVFEACDWHGARLRGAVLEHARFVRCDLTHAGLEGVRARGVHLSDCSLDHSNGTAGDWRAARWERCSASEASFVGASFEAATLMHCAFAGLQATRWRAARAHIDTCCLEGTDFGEATLSRTSFVRCTADRASFARADITGAQWRAVHGRGLVFSGATLCNWRVWGGTTMSGADFVGADLRESSWRESAFPGALLRDAVLDRALIFRCDLSGADATRAIARETQFTGSRFVHACWRDANLMGASLRKATLADVDFTGANLHGLRARGARATGVRIARALVTRCELLELDAYE